MKFILFFSLFVGTLFSCTGDCFSCHPSLLKNINNDIRHLPMKTCKTCHYKDTIKGLSACGADCFSCHSIYKIKQTNIPKHKVISSCIKCHSSSNIFKANTSVKYEPLFDFLLNK